MKKSILTVLTIAAIFGTSVVPAYADVIYSGNSQAPVGSEGSRAVQGPGAPAGAAASAAAGTGEAVFSSTPEDFLVDPSKAEEAAIVPFPQTELVDYTLQTRILQITDPVGTVLKSLPQEDGAPVEILYSGTILDLEDDTMDGWYRVKYDGKDAYVSKDCQAKVLNSIQMQPGLEYRAMVVGYAFQLLGEKYTYGGRSVADGFDCSGFVKVVLANTMALQMGSNTKSQVKQGNPIDASQIQPGDLIFYGESEDTVYHVEMYIGNNMAIHASQAGRGVVVDPCYNTADIFRIISVIPNL